MRPRLCALVALLTLGIAPIFTATAAYADSIEEITVAHRGATTSQLAEGTLPAYQYAVKNHADMLDADVRWTKDGSDPDNLGTMVVLHDATLDRTTNCTGAVSSWLWSAIRDRCRTDIGDQKLMRLVDLLKYGNSVGKSFALEIKTSPITDAQAKQFWNAIKNSRVQLAAMSGRLAALNKIKKLDAADASHKISYALATSGTGGWPSVSTIKGTGSAVYAQLTIPADVARSYRQANIKVFLFTSRNESDDAKMIALEPYAVVVNDVARFQHWRDTTKGSA
ncbi:MAG TPA: glycerophosphodiester phosphodiesterase family protein [Propionibacteriaceae bacterium]|nr:glycerophosphodiester phosphodiesterase family protein [Propionibacteriaceae bacterium]